MRLYSSLGEREPDTQVLLDGRREGGRENRKGREATAELVCLSPVAIRRSYDSCCNGGLTELIFCSSFKFGLEFVNDLSS